MSKSTDFEININKEYNLIHITTQSEICKLIYEFDTVFTPNISQQVSDLDLYADKLHHNAIVYAAIKKHVLIGFISFYNNDIIMNEAYLAQIAVKEKNKNIGKSLLDLCTKTSKRNGMRTLKLEVFNQNDKAIRFYQKNGFIFFGKASEESMYMIKNL